MKFLQKNKTIVIALVVFLLAIYAYNYFEASTPAATEESAQSIGTDVVELYQGLNSVTLDRSSLNNNLYKSLTDWSPAVTEQPVGRTNPFATIGQ